MQTSILFFVSGQTLKVQWSQNTKVMWLQDQPKTIDLPPPCYAASMKRLCQCATQLLAKHFSSGFLFPNEIIFKNIVSSGRRTTDETKRDCTFCGGVGRRDVAVCFARGVRYEASHVVFMLTQTRCSLRIQTVCLLGQWAAEHKPVKIKLWWQMGLEMNAAHGYTIYIQKHVKVSKWGGN